MSGKLKIVHISPIFKNKQSQLGYLQRKARNFKHTNKAICKIYYKRRLYSDKRKTKKNVQELYEENYERLLKEKNVDLNKWKDIPCSWKEHLTTVKCSISGLPWWHCG